MDTNTHLCLTHNTRNNIYPDNAKLALATPAEVQCVTLVLAIDNVRWAMCIQLKANLRIARNVTARVLTH